MARISQAALVGRIQAAKSRPRRKKKPRSKDDPLEHNIQARTISTLIPMLIHDAHVYAIPNGGFRLPTEAIRLKAEGVRRGIVDLVFIGPNRFVGFLEMKRRNGVLSDEQEGFRNICIRCGHFWGEARSVEEAVAVVRSWGLLRVRA